MTRSRALRPLRRLRAVLLAGAAAASLAGCQSMSLGTFDGPTTSAVGAEAQTEMLFRPGAPEPLPGQVEQVNALLRGLVLRPQDDVILTFGPTGSDRLDAARMAEARRLVAARPARLRLVGPLGFARAPERPDVVLVQVVRYDRVTVVCPGNGRTNEDPAQITPLPGAGCDNAVNLAAMAAEKRDLSAPGRLTGSDAIPSIRAVQRYRAGDVSVAPLEMDASN